ncbi:MAG: filamentous hemagglutinin N-terminal domain-containing protein [Crocosphaera sp.]|nr:filamentous hemagglutinin N-terminal domain-containing protein [Crocosphaera sp.]
MKRLMPFQPLHQLTLSQSPWLSILCSLPIATGITVFTPQTSVFAQAIQADGTLPTNSIVNQAGNNYTINGGTQSGANLFHSFSQFSVPNFGSATFNNGAAIANIISRVTGNNISDIQGTIRANGGANLFLINPNGITFGPNATLDIGGSFIASTADSVTFLGGGEFSATNPGSFNPLMTMTAPMGLQMGSNPGNIIVQGNGNNLVTDPTNFEIRQLPTLPFGPFGPVTLTVDAGETLALVGGNITFDGGNVAAPQGRVELGAFSNGLVNLTTQNGQLQLAPAVAGITYNNIQMNNGSSVNVSDDSAGSVQIQGSNLILNSGSVILANTTGNGTGGEINIRTTESIQASGVGEQPPSPPPPLFAYRIFSGIFADVSSASGPGAQGGQINLQTGTLSLTDGAQIGANTFGAGQAGQLNINSNAVQISGENILGPSGLFAAVAPEASGPGGTINLTTGNLQMQDRASINVGTFGNGDGGTANINAAQIELIGVSSQDGDPTGIFGTAESNATGNGGTVIINAETLRVRDGANIGLTTFGDGNGGTGIIKASNIELIGTAPDGRPSGIFNNVEENATGQGGNLTIDSRTLTLRDGANIEVSTLSSGNSGMATIKATELNIVGTSSLGNPSGIFSNVGSNAIREGGGLRVDADNRTTGQGGRLRVDAENLRLTDGGQIGSLTFSVGNGGILDINASNIEIEGTSGSRPSGIVSQVGRVNDLNDRTLGNGGQININTNQLKLSDGGIISTNTAGLGRAGNMTINAQNVQVTGGVRQTASGLFSAVTEGGRGNGGDITLNTQSLSVKDGGQIAASTAGSGNGGNLTITARFIDLSGESPLGASGLFANAINGTGNGGNIRVQTENLTIRDGATINVGNFPSRNTGVRAGQGAPGNIDIEAKSIILNSQGTITADTVAGSQGNITLNTDSLELNWISSISTNARGDGSGGNITINTNNLNVQEMSSISANAQGAGSAGNVTIEGRSQNPEINLSQSEITATGNQGNVRISSENLQLEDGSVISANAEGNGDGGNVILINDQAITLNSNSVISSNAEGTGQGGNIDLVTGTLNVLDNSEIAANASETSGGNILVRVTSPRTLTLDSGKITATGGQGNITLDSPITFLRNGSLISTNGLGTEPGGNIIIHTNFLLSFPTENNDITANAQQSRGGRVIIKSLGVFGIEFREFLTPLSDITVTSELGPAFAGEVSIRVPEGDPTSGFTKLPENTIDPRDLLVVSCAADEGNVFIRTGKGGLPDNPDQSLRWRVIWEDLRDFIELDDPDSTPYSPQSDSQRSHRNCTDFQSSQG